MIYDKTVQHVFNLLEPEKGEIGLEIEMEGDFLPHENIGPWTHHREPSLRGHDNAEYVLDRPLPREKVKGALSELFTFLKERDAKYKKNSTNTSIHVHVNFWDWSIKAVYTFMTIWYIFEIILVELCGDDRAGNMFCLRAMDAELALQKLAKAVKTDNYQVFTKFNEYRYLALNFCSLAKLGSLEVRSMEGNYSEDAINTWVNIILKVKDYAAKFDSPPKVIEEFSRVGASQMFEDCFQELAPIVKTKTYLRDMQEGMRLCQPVAYATDWNKKEKKKLVPDEPELVPGKVGLDPIWVRGDRALNLRAAAQQFAERIVDPVILDDFDPDGED